MYPYYSCICMRVSTDPMMTRFCGRIFPSPLLYSAATSTKEACCKAPILMNASVLRIQVKILRGYSSIAVMPLIRILTFTLIKQNIQQTGVCVRSQYRLTCTFTFTTFFSHWVHLLHVFAQALSPHMHRQRDRTLSPTAFWKLQIVG